MSNPTPMCVACKVRLGRIRDCGEYICDYCYDGDEWVEYHKPP